MIVMSKKNLHAMNLKFSMIIHYTVPKRLFQAGNPHQSWSAKQKYSCRATQNQSETQNMALT